MFALLKEIKKGILLSVFVKLICVLNMVPSNIVYSLGEILRVALTGFKTVQILAKTSFGYISLEKTAPKLRLSLN